MAGLVDFQDDLWLNAIVFPALVLATSWFWTRQWRLASRAIFTALCVLVSWPDGFVAIVTFSVGWRFVLEPGHNPGWAIALVPLTLGWFVSIGAWACGLLVALWQHHRLRASAPAHP
jgi:hypothetical protein